MSEEGRACVALLSDQMAIASSAVMEFAVRQLAEKQGITLVQIQQEVALAREARERREERERRER
jgi:hypothetical protein